MKASEAMRKGAKFRPQVREAFFRPVDSQEHVGSCALGAMLEGYAGKTEDFGSVPLEIPAVLRTKTVCPKCRGGKDECVSIIEHLNDTHRWTREQIADWLEEQGL